MRLFSVILLLVLCSSCLCRKKNLISVNEENWKDLLKGEWMVEFHAPWCPACKDLQKAWDAFSGWSTDLKIKVAEVDVTKNPGLSGRFLVTALPTIYHVKDGVFRVYSGPRDKKDFISYIEDEKWSLYEPVPSYKHPNSAQMSIVAWFFKLSMFVRDKHNYLVDEAGLPSAVSYLIFALFTLLVGCILGFFIVCIIDRVFPTGPVAVKSDKKSVKKDQKLKNKKVAKRSLLDEHKKKDENKSHDEESSDDSKVFIFFYDAAKDSSGVRNRTPANDKKDAAKVSPKVENKKKK
uniref:Thioredoxin-related transmembrane protein 1 n=1 Tax=Syphacia muris TaxID=451379 RepID=A0A0N5AEI7_9BILA